MSQRPLHPRILLIGRWDSYLERFTQALEAMQYSVHGLDMYEHPSFEASIQEEMPDLIVLSCLSVGQEESQLISRLLAMKQHLLVVSTLLPLQTMRRLFLLGVDEATDRPSHPQRLVMLLQQTLTRIAFSGHRSQEPLKGGSVL